MKKNSFQKLLEFLKKLEDAKISFSLEFASDETIGVFISVPGERWEVDFFANGDVWVERFTNPDKEIKKEEELEELFRLYSD
jgi:hypothetical protein